MAEISSYPLKTPKSGDLIMFSETYDANAENPVVGNPTKSATVQSIANLANAVQLGYTSLVQLLTQTSTNAPVATEVYNNTGDTFTWSYVSTGVYRITSTGTPFTVNKTIVFLNPGATGVNFFEPLWNRISDAIIEVRVGNDGDITGGSFEVKIYN
jgi:hypothetical protein